MTHLILDEISVLLRHAIDSLNEELESTSDVYQRDNLLSDRRLLKNGQKGVRAVSDILANSPRADRHNYSRWLSVVLCAVPIAWRYRHSSVRKTDSS